MVANVSHFLTIKGKVHILLLADILELLGNEELLVMASVNKHLHKYVWRYIYFRATQEYPQVSLIGCSSTIPSMVKMYLPPRIVVCPAVSPEAILGTTRYIFPMSASQQPQIYCDPRVTDTFASMASSQKAKAIWDYATKVESLRLSIITCCAERYEGFSAPVYKHSSVKYLVLGRSVPSPQVLSVDAHKSILYAAIDDYPFILQCLTKDEISKIKVCFCERKIKEIFRQHCVSTSRWALLYSQKLLNSNSLKLVADTRVVQTIN